MEREIKRNDFGQIVSYEITSSNEEYGKVYLESGVVKFDEDSYNEKYPLELNNFELQFEPVLVAFDITQNSFPFYEFGYKTASTVLSNGVFPVWEMKGLSVSNVGAGNSHPGACNRWADEESYYTTNPIWEISIDNFIFKDSEGVTALVFMDDNKKMAFMSLGVKRSFKLEKGTGKILDIHICDDTGPIPLLDNSTLKNFMVGSDENSNNWKSAGPDRAFAERRDEANFWITKTIEELGPGDYIYRFENDNQSTNPNGYPIPDTQAYAIVLGTGDTYWKAFQAGSMRKAFKLEKRTGKILDIRDDPTSTPNVYANNNNISGYTEIRGPQDVTDRRVGSCNDARPDTMCYLNGKELWELQTNDFIYDGNRNVVKDPNNDQWIIFQGSGNSYGVKRRIKVDKSNGKILEIEICPNSYGVPMPTNQITNPMWNMIGGNPDATTEWDAETGGAACNRYKTYHTYWTFNDITLLGVGDYIYKSPNNGLASNTFIPNNFNTKWFAFQAGGRKRAFKIERGTGKILQTHDC